MNLSFRISSVHVKEDVGRLKREVVLTTKDLSLTL